MTHGRTPRSTSLILSSDNTTKLQVNMTAVWMVNIMQIQIFTHPFPSTAENCDSSKHQQGDTNTLSW